MEWGEHSSSGLDVSSWVSWLVCDVWHVCVMGPFSHVSIDLEQWIQVNGVSRALLVWVRRKFVSSHTCHSIKLYSHTCHTSHTNEYSLMEWVEHSSSGLDESSWVSTDMNLDNYEIQKIGTDFNVVWGVRTPRITYCRRKWFLFQT